MFAMTQNYRVSSIDIFRGLTMLLMIFVNDLANVHGLPWWNYHLPATANGMTYVDMVFPTFLFIVGLSLPLATNRRLAKGDTMWQLWRHILARTSGLLVLGIALANADACTSMSPNLWGFLVLVSGILFWLVDSRFRYVGLAGLLVLFVLFRRGNHWLAFGYWEILGIIGWTYLAVCLVYIPTRRWKFAPLLWLVVFCAYNCWSPIQLPMQVWPFSNGAFCLLVFAGIVAAQIIFTGDFFTVLRQKVAAGLIYAALLFVAGLVLLPFGISKIRATPTWCLFTAAAAMLILVGLHWLCDVRQKTRWAAFAKPAGTNTILTYLLPDLYYFGIGLSFFNQGLPGVLRAVIFTGVMLGLSALLTRWNIRMQL
jgi:predicted acyltransferase